MKAQQRLDRILEPITTRVQDEVGALMGASLELSPPQTELLTKEDCIFQLVGKQVIAKMDITGEIEGYGCLCIGVKDAIRLGGTLIMLPPSELDEVIRNEDYNEETEDSYGEIANIIAGSYTKVFEDMYPDNCRFVRKEQVLIAPVKVDIESEEPVPNQVYYQVSSSMTLDGTEMGNLVMLIPAETFGIDTSGIAPAEEAPAPSQESAPPPSEAEASDQVSESTAEPVDREEGNDGVEESVEPAAKESGDATSSPPTQAVAQASPEKLEKQRKRIDAILESCRARMGEEVGALLGVEVKISDLVNKPISKEDFLLEETAGKQVLAHMQIVDKEEDNSFLFVSLKDAIRIGGVLIMLPPSEIEAAVNEEEFSVDAEDAYGEIANIVSGVYTSVFQEQFSANIRFIKTELEEVLPMKVNIEDDEPLPDILYYMSSGKMAIDGSDLGRIQMLIPLEVLSLTGLGVEPSPAEASASEDGKGAIPASSEAVSEGPMVTEADAAGTSSEAVGTSSAAGTIRPETDVLIIGDDDIEIAKILKFVNGAGHTGSAITVKDNAANYLTSNIKIIFLVVREVDEQSFGLVIKVSAMSSVPLVAAGPGWTRTKVINAVKYGVDDILLTPATDEDIQEKVEANLVPMAA